MFELNKVTINSLPVNLESIYTLINWDYSDYSQELSKKHFAWGSLVSLSRTCQKSTLINKDPVVSNFLKATYSSSSKISPRLNRNNSGNRIDRSFLPINEKKSCSDTIDFGQLFGFYLPPLRNTKLFILKLTFFGVNDKGQDLPLGTCEFNFSNLERDQPNFNIEIPLIGNLGGNLSANFVRVTSISNELNDVIIKLCHLSRNWVESDFDSNNIKLEHIIGKIPYSNETSYLYYLHQQIACGALKLSTNPRNIRRILKILYDFKIINSNVNPCRNVLFTVLTKYTSLSVSFQNSFYRHLFEISNGILFDINFGAFVGSIKQIQFCFNDYSTLKSEYFIHHALVIFQSLESAVCTLLMWHFKPLIFVSLFFLFNFTLKDCEIESHFLPTELAFLFHSNLVNFLIRMLASFLFRNIFSR